jgi:protein-glutamine gamma-glutamyltransferase
MMGGPELLDPTLRVGTHVLTLRVAVQGDSSTQKRRKARTHAERGNENGYGAMSCKVVLASAFFAFLARPCWADEQPLRLPLDTAAIQASLGTDWYGVYIQGKKVGTFRSARSLAGKEGDTVYVDSENMRMKLVSLGQKTEMTMRQTLEFDTRPPYALRRAEVTETSGASTQHYLLSRSEKGFHLTYSAGGQTRTRQVAAVDYTLSDSLTDEIWLRRGAKPGAHIVTRSFDVKELELDLYTSKLVATKTSMVKGVAVVYHEVETVSRKEKITTLARHDDKGRLLSGTMGGFIELRLETEAQAKNTEYSADLFVLGMARVDRELGRARRVSELEMEIVGKDGAVFPAGPRQTLAADAAGKMVLKLGKRHGRQAPASAKEMTEALAETTAYPISDPKAQALARQAVGDAQTPREKVKRLVQFVHHFVEPSLTGDGPNFYELLERKKGDCKSYALLLTTLARAAGIPAREVGGLVYMGDDQKAFGGHAWNEVVLDGCWVPVDASCGELEIDATHISFGSDAEGTKNMVNALGKLSFKLIAVQHTK